MLITKSRALLLFSICPVVLTTSFNWSSIEPSSYLQYHSCYGDFDCARLDVPLDWTNLSNPNSIKVAITRLPAKVNKSDPSYGGTIILNPGGPSGSGVDHVLWIGKYIQQIVDGEKKFEIASFDPRGTRYTTPSSSCFGSDEARTQFQLRSSSAGTVDSGDYAFSTAWAEKGGVGRLCAETAQGVYPDGSNVRQYLTTLLVAHDMVAIIDKMQEEEESAEGDGRSDDTQQQRLRSSTATSEPALLNYWGMSYGTLLGNTFASMFPSRVGRMILDGVVDGPDYVAAGWTTNLWDNNQVVRTFFDWCFDAGSKCELSRGFRDAASMQSVILTLMHELKEEPMTYITDSDLNLFTYSEFLDLFHLANYAPYQYWPRLSKGLAALLQGDPTPMFAISQVSSVEQYIDGNETEARLPTPDDDFDRWNNRSSPGSPGYPHSYESGAAIACTDGDQINDRPREEFVSYLNDMIAQSSTIGPWWAKIMLSCRNWPSRARAAAKNRFTGPFRSKLSDYDPRGSPLLFIGNTADPVTPLRNARNMAREHEGAEVLVLDSPGHCSGPNIPSKCIWETAKVFFNQGRLPKPGTTCTPDWRPWDNL